MVMFVGDNQSQAVPPSSNIRVPCILNGYEKHTTIMLRNIPDQITQPMLKRVLDEISFGRYNFMYLRIDVTNQRNFGYAFINFLDPLDVADFGARMIGRRWCEFLLNLTVYDPKSDHYIPIPGSNALVSTSYATVQGLDHLVQKFKNHCVMFEHPLARPKVMSPFLHVVLAFSNYQVCRYSTPILTRWYRKRPPSPLPMIPLERAPAP